MNKGGTAARPYQLGTRAWQRAIYCRHRPTQDITPRNGQITFSSAIPPTPTPSSSAVCPNGNWTVVLTSLTYTDVVLHVQQPLGTDVLTDNLGTIDL